MKGLSQLFVVIRFQICIFDILNTAGLYHYAPNKLL